MKKDLRLGILAGFFMGLLFLPVLKVVKSDLYSRLVIFILPFFIIATPTGLLVAKLISQKIAVVWQLAKFVVTGGLNALMDLGVLSLLTFLALNYLDIDPTETIFSVGVVITFYSIFKAISFIVANINSYFWNKYWTFEKKDGKKAEFLQFFIVSIIGFFVNVLAASFVFESVEPLFGLNITQWGLIGAAVGSVVGLVWNFLGYKFIVFKK